MSNTGPKTFSLDHDPLTPLDKFSTPTPEAVRKLRQEVYANAQSVASNHGGGNHGHLGMVMPPGDYTRISTGGAEYSFPTQPAIPTYSANAATRGRQRDQYERNLRDYDEARALRNQLKSQLIRAIPEAHRDVLADPDLGYANVTPFDILHHMIETYGEISEQDLQHNLQTLVAPWDPETTITGVFINGNRCRKLAAEGGDPISDRTYTRALVTIFRNSGVMEEALKDWEKLPKAQKTVGNAIKHFTEHDKLRREAKQYLKDALTANTAMSNPPPVPPSDAALSASTPASLPPPPPARTRPCLMGWGYCWSHGVTKHDGYTCHSPSEGHIKEATIEDRRGGVWRLPGRIPPSPAPDRRYKRRRSEAPAPGR